MSNSNEERFQKELQEAKEKLEKLGREVSIADTPNQSDDSPRGYVLPYSSLPKFVGTKWHSKKR